MTDPEPENKGALAHLPNSVLRFRAWDLAGAARAEIQIDRWGGHPGTTAKKIRINAGEWLPLPELTTTPADHDPTRYMSQDNPTLPIPVSALREGTNTLEGTAGDQLKDVGFGWGQWGWYGAVIRVYYDPAVKTHTRGRLVTPAPRASFGEHPAVTVAVDGDAQRVDVLAWYNGYDENGDGVFEDWHHVYRSVDLTGHVGSAMGPPWNIVWDTTWVPDQRPESIRLAARIRGPDGIWFVTPVVDRLSLVRHGSSVKLYRPRDVPERFWVRGGRRMDCALDIPNEHRLADATEAVAAIRTWNGAHERVRVNDHVAEIGGSDHHFALTYPSIPAGALKSGENRIEFHSDTTHHGPEILWPGPALLVRYGGRAPGVPEQTAWLNPDYEIMVPVNLTTDRPIRSGKVLELDLDLEKVLRESGIDGRADPATLRVIEFSDAARRAPKDLGLPVQTAEGGVAILLRSAQEPGEERYLSIYFSREDRGAPRLEWPTHVALSEAGNYQGQDSYRIRVANGEFVYQKEGAGFASLLDREGADWISYRPGQRSAGEFRGIPNLGAVFHPGYEGERGSTTTAAGSGPFMIRLRSESRDGEWTADWDFFPSYARMTLRKAPAPYWFLYEGTPGGALDLDKDYWVTADGARRSMEETWNADIEGPEWLYFGDERKSQVLFLANHQDDDANDQFWQMEGNMTVWGFGRQYRCCGKYLTAVPAVFTVGFSAAGEHSASVAEVESAMARPAGRVGKPVVRPRAGN